jgi:hypothetical protein
LRLKATASAGYEFKSWSNGENNNPWEIKLENSDISVTANFAADTSYAAPNSFTAQGSMAFDSSGGISIMGAHEQISIRVSSFKTGGNFDFANISLSGNTYKVSNLPLGEACVIEAVRDGRAKLKSLVWGTTDGENKTANLTPTSSVVVDIVSANTTLHAALKTADPDMSIIEDIQSEVTEYYATNTGDLNAIIGILNNGQTIALADLPAAVLDAVDGVVDDAVVAYTLPEANITIEGSFGDWDNVPVAWQNVSEKWGAPGDVAERAGGLIKSIRYAKSSDGKKLYYFLKLRDGEYFASDGQYGLYISTKEIIEDDENFDGRKDVNIALHSGGSFFAYRMDAIMDGAHNPNNPNYDPDRAVTAKHAKSSSGTGVLEVEIDIDSLKSVLPSDTFGEGKYQARIISSLHADDQGHGERLITRTPRLMLDLN